MAITPDMIAVGLVTSSFFLMAISIPRIILVLTASLIRFWFLSKMQQDEEANNILLPSHRWVSKIVYDAWKTPKKRVELISRELTKIIELYRAYLEGLTAAALLIIAALYLGIDSGAGLAVAFTISLILVSVIAGIWIALGHMDKLHNMLSEAETDQPISDEPKEFNSGVEPSGL